MTSVHPGRLFVQKHGKAEAYEDVLAYADFLRAEAGLDDVVPVDLYAILDHFQLPQPQSLPLSNQQALLIDSECGTILINSEDPAQRQRFSLAHELAEMLFSVLPQWTGLLRLPGGFRERTKEKLCDCVAANLLMPSNYVQQLIQQHNVSLECAKFLSDKCDVSLTAALVQLARLSPRRHFIVLWRMKNKPAEIKKAPRPEQMALFQMPDIPPPRKLRVEWSIGSPDAPFIPKDKSTEDSSFIFTAWKTNSFSFGKERMTFDNRSAAWFYSENMPFESDGERFVISLIERLGQNSLCCILEKR